MDKLTEAQRRALGVLAKGPVAFAEWGGRPTSRMPDGIRSRSTLWALQDKGLATPSRNFPRTTWTITPAGRAALGGTDG